MVASTIESHAGTEAPKQQALASDGVVEKVLR